MALNILVGYTGLISFGHGAWFGLAAYAAAIMQREYFKDAFLLPLAIGMGSVLALSAVFGFLILRRRGVYFSLLTLAMAAMLYAVAFRWDRGHRRRERAGRHRAAGAGGFSFENTAGFYAMVAAIGFRRSSPCCGASTARRSAACWWRSARTSSARASWATPPTATSW
jgi:ABC-type branched-subunit amino acid transport system permease subunit